jgi:hypothetical protein
MEEWRCRLLFFTLALGGFEPKRDEVTGGLEKSA